MQPNPVDATAAVPSVVAETLATVSRHGGLAEGRTETALQGLARAAVEAVSSAQMASLTAFDASGRPFTPVFTSDEAGAMDQAQYLSAGGPSLEAATSPRWISVTVTDLMTESRWPHLTDDALGLGIRSVLSVSLFAEVSLDLDDDSPSVGALTLYSREPDAFGEPERIIALLLALFWAGLLRSSAAIDAADLQLDHLHQAMLSRNVIGQAQGILMERERLTSGQAFDRLRTASQHLNRKLRDVAAQVAETGVIPVIDGHREPQPTKSADIGEEYRLAAVRRYDILDTPPDGAFDRIAALAGRLLQVPIGMVNIVDSDRDGSKPPTGYWIGRSSVPSPACASPSSPGTAHTWSPTPPLTPAPANTLWSPATNRSGSMPQPRSSPPTDTASEPSPSWTANPTTRSPTLSSPSWKISPPSLSTSSNCASPPFNWSDTSTEPDMDPRMRTGGAKPPSNLRRRRRTPPSCLGADSGLSDVCPRPRWSRQLRAPSADGQ